MSKTSKSISEFHMQEARNLIKRKEAKKTSMSTVQKQELDTEIRTSIFEAIFNYGT